MFFSQRMQALMAAFVLLVSVSAHGAGQPAFKTDLWAGFDVTGGDVTYEIGGTVRQGALVEEVHFPLSRLEWPMNVAMLSIGGSVEAGDFDARAVASRNITSESGTMKDSDWEIEGQPDVLTTYSESDAELSAMQLDGSVRYWVSFPTSNERERVRLGGGVGVLYQDFSWDANDTDQWYPQNPGLGHDIFRGTTISYDAKVLMPYVEVGGKLNYGALYLEGRVGLSPYTQVEDVDDHRLRYIKAETDSDGTGAFAELIGRYTFQNNIFLQGSFWAMAFDVEGTEKDHVYAGPEAGTRWEIEHKVTSSQARLTVAGGISF